VYFTLLGAPGAGKGTQAVIASQWLGLVHIASGDLFREGVEKGTELGLLAKPYMEKGLLVPDEVTVGMIVERIEALNHDQGFILDGFPRTMEQAQALDRALGERGKALDRAVYIEVSTEELVHRLSGRWICHNCQAPYNAVSSPPRVPGKCDSCGGELYQRPDDKVETVGKRLEVYFAQTTPLLSYYREGEKLVGVNGEQGVNEVARELIAALHH
jgi:adenylate kinase